MAYNLFLDDVLSPPAFWEEDCDDPLFSSKTEWVVVRNYDEFVRVIEQMGTPDYISLDYNLGEVKTGLDCVQYLVDHNIKVKDFRFHTGSWEKKKLMYDLYTPFWKGEIVCHICGKTHVKDQNTWIEFEGKPVCSHHIGVQGVQA